MANVRQAVLFGALALVAYLPSNPAAPQNNEPRAVSFLENGTGPRIVIKNKGVGPVFVGLHANEDTSINAASSLRGKHITMQGGSRLLRVATAGKSLSFDPNRIFTEAGINNASKGEVSEDLLQVVRAVADLVKKEISGRRLVVGLHNNTPGGYSILHYVEGGPLSRDAAIVNIVPEMDPDNFVLTTNTALYNKAVRLGFNAVLQSRNPSDDGSLSVYCARAGVAYLNVEAEHGQYAIQRFMLQSLLN